MPATSPSYQAAVLPTEKSPGLSKLAKEVGRMSSQQMDASHQQRVNIKHTMLPVVVDPNKLAKIPTREEDVADLVWQSQSLQRRKSRKAQRSQSRPHRNQTEQVYIPTGYESTFHQEQAMANKKEKQEKMNSDATWNVGRLRRKGFSTSRSGTSYTTVEKSS